MTWEVLDSQVVRGRATMGDMYLRVSRTGTASISRNAVEALGEPAYVVILIDYDRNLFGIRQAESNERGARAARKVGTGYTRTFRFSDVLRLVNARKKVGVVPLQLKDGILIGSLSDLTELEEAQPPKPRKRRTEQDAQEKLPF